MVTFVPAGTGSSNQVIVIPPANAGSSDSNSTRRTIRAPGNNSRNRPRTTSECSEVFPGAEWSGSSYVSTIRYRPPSRGSNSSTRAFMPRGGGHDTQRGGVLRTRDKCALWGRIDDPRCGIASPPGIAGHGSILPARCPRPYLIASTGLAHAGSTLRTS